MLMMKSDLKKVEEFELKFALFRNEMGAASVANKNNE
jgi:hypothetical protein